MTTAVAPRIATTSTISPTPMSASSSKLRAVQRSPSILTLPMLSSLAIRSRTIALRPTSAAVPVRSAIGTRRWRRASGRSVRSDSTDTHSEDHSRDHEAHPGQARSGGDQCAGGQRSEEEAARVQFTGSEGEGRDQPNDRNIHGSIIPSSRARETTESPPTRQGRLAGRDAGCTWLVPHVEVGRRSRATGARRPRARPAAGCVCVGKSGRGLGRGIHQEIYYSTS